MLQQNVAAFARIPKSINVAGGNSKRQRTASVCMSEEEAMAFIQQKVPEILAYGKLAKQVDGRGGRRAEITYKNSRVVLALNRDGERETWVITGFEDW